MTGLVVRKVRGKLKLVPAVRKVIGEGLVKLERVWVICPAYGQQVEAVASDGRVKGYCAAAKQSVDFVAESRDTSGRFIKGNMPWNKRGVKSND